MGIFSQQKSLLSTHKLKVRGSNPLPRNQITPLSQRLGGAGILGLHFDPESGSTVEARGCVVVSKTAS
jgi:hypothetical protein